MVLSYLVAWNVFHLEKASTSFEGRRGCALYIIIIIILRHNNAAFCSLGAQVNADPKLMNGSHHTAKCWIIF